MKETVKEILIYKTAAGKPTHFSRGMKAARNSILF